MRLQRRALYERSLKSLTGLNNLTAIGKNLSLNNNKNLTSLTALENLTSINGFITIWNNNALVSLSGLDNSDANSIIGLNITENSSLSICEVKSICDYLLIPFPNVEIYYNAAGCDHPQEIVEACTSAIDDINSDYSLTIHPNPCSESAYLHVTRHASRITSIDLYSISGMKIKQLLEEEIIPGEHEIEIDVSYLPAGIYFIRTQLGSSTIINKLVVLD